MLDLIMPHIQVNLDSPTERRWINTDHIESVVDEKCVSPMKVRVVMTTGREHILRGIEALRFLDTYCATCVSTQRPDVG